MHFELKNLPIQARKALVFFALSLVPLLASAQPKKSDLSNPMVQVMLIIMLLLLLGIAILANVVKGAAELYIKKQSAETVEAKPTTHPVSALLVLTLLGSLPATAQDAVAAPSASIGGVSPTVFYLMAGVIFAELLVMVMLANQLRSLINVEVKKVAKPALAVAQPKISWWWRINKAYALEKEKDIDLNHDYDGIRELDNSIPPWWLGAFFASILFGVVYLWRYHVAENAPLQLEEYTIAVQKAEVQQAAYLKRAANNVDENTIAMLDASGIEAGKGLFAQNCVACHGAEGQGAAVGPNLTDDYWIHGGNLQSIFKTIKYGVTEKGMRAWKDDMTPVQMAQLTSYVKTLKGTNPPNPKEPQGQLETDTPKPDSTGMVPTR
jgi:cytochrome c oxidase cbb3-type subunit 3